MNSSDVLHFCMAATKHPSITLTLTWAGKMYPCRCFTNRMRALDRMTCRGTQAHGWKEHASNPPPVADEP